MRSNCKAFFSISDQGEKALVDGTISGLAVLGSIREQAEQVRGCKPVKNIPPWPLHQLLFLVLCCFGLVLVFRDRFSLYSPGCPGAHFVGQAGLELRNQPASASRVLGLKACATTPGSAPAS